MKPRRDVLLSAVLFALLAPGILASHAWSLTPSTGWLLSALAALGLGIAFVVLGAGLWRRKWQRLAWTLVGTQCLALFQAARALSYYFQGEGFNERFFFHFNLNALLEAGPAYATQVLAVAGLLLTVSLGVVLLVPPRRPAYGHAWITLLALPAFLGLEPAVRQALAAAGAEQITLTVPEDIPWDELGLDPGALRAPLGDAPEAGRNLVLIYLEGLERVYTEAGAFPGLTPNLARLADDALRFPGFVSTEGTTWTVGGVLASQCGTPLLHDLGAGGNDILQGGFLDRAHCLGDVLAAAGYRQVFMGGASTRFAGKGSFLAAHGYDEVLGREELAPLLEDPGYQTGWGLYDDSLLALAAAKFAELAAGDAPFNLSLLTLDTHHPDGHASASCPRYAAIDNSILHAVHCTDFLLGNFLETLRAHPAWRDTVVVLMTDHLAMRNVAQPLYPTDYERRPLWYVLNAGAGEIDRPASHMDVAPTLLDLLEVRSGARFLAGRSLLADDVGAVDYSAPDRLRALRYINTALLTGGGASLCRPGEPMIAFEDGSLRLGGLRLGEEEALLSVSDIRLAPRSLESSHALIVMLGAEGRLLSLNVTELPTLGHLLYTLRDESLLLIGPSAGLPALAVPPDEGSGVVALLGNARAGFVELAQASTVEGLHAALPDCLRQTATAASIGSASDAEVLAAVCPADAVAGYLRPDALHLPQVSINGEWFTAVLDGSPAEGYALRERQPLEADDVFSACPAWFSNGRLIVPRVDGAAEVDGLTMRMVPGTDGVFDAIRVFPPS